MNLESIKKEIIDIETQMKSYDAKYKDTDVEIRNLVAEIQKIEEAQKIKKQREDQLKAIIERSKTQETKIAELKQKLSNINNPN
jgi:uncharacterized protein involved in exopolysaccharide biosynthesis